MNALDQSQSTMSVERSNDPSTTHVEMAITIWIYLKPIGCIVLQAERKSLLNKWLNHQYLPFWPIVWAHWFLFHQSCEQTLRTPAEQTFHSEPRLWLNIGFSIKLVLCLNRVDEYKHELQRCGRLVQGVMTQNLFFEDMATLWRPNTLIFKNRYAVCYHLCPGIFSCREWRSHMIRADQSTVIFSFCLRISPFHVRVLNLILPLLLL